MRVTFFKLIDGRWVPDGEEEWNLEFRPARLLTDVGERLWAEQQAQFEVLPPIHIEAPYEEEEDYDPFPGFRLDPNAS